MITINQNKLDKFVEQAQHFVDDRDSQQALVELLQAQKKIDDLVEFIKTGLKASLQAEGLSFVEGDLVKVITYSSGARYQLTDSSIAPPEVLDIKVNSKAVEAWEENHNELPAGVSTKEQTTAIRITLK